MECPMSKQTPEARVLAADIPVVLSDLSFFVAGKAVPGGSKRGFAFRRGNGRLGVSMMDAGKGNAEWKAWVKFTAMRTMEGRALFDGPLELTLVFVRQRPGRHFDRKGLIRPKAMGEQPTGPPDVLKLARAVEDGCNGIVWVDDRLIVKETLTKRYAGQGEKSGVHVWVKRWAANERTAG